jgi:anti-sigma regulatory factor (Ser/Thr protein kinase)
MAPVRPGAGRARPLDELELPAVHASVPRARAFMRALVTARAVQHVRDDAEVLVSELVTNAVRHAATPASTLRLTVLRAGSRLRIEVHDPSPFPPRIRRVDLMDETGRGWFLVAAIADRHGTDQTASGKSVWCELTAWPAPAPPLPE